MRKIFTISDLKNSACAKLNQHLFVETKAIKKQPKPQKGSKEKIWIHEQLQNYCNENNYQLTTEHSFHPARRWRFDWAIEETMTAYEYEGIMSKKSRHTTISGFNGDADKYNQATLLGWKVIRLTVINYKTIIELLK